MDELLLGAAVAHENPKTMNGGPKYHAPIPPRMIMAHVSLPGRLTPSRDYIWRVLMVLEAVLVVLEVVLQLLLLQLLLLQLCVLLKLPFPLSGGEGNYQP